VHVPAPLASNFPPVSSSVLSINLKRATTIRKPGGGGGPGSLFSTDNNMSTMRGLTTFISDLRNARARELEERRINKELANIRSKFKGNTPTVPHLLPFTNRRRC